MTLEEKLEKFKSGTAAFYAPTRESYDRLMVILDKLGYIWANGRKPSNKSYDRWGEYRGNTCIYDKCGTCIIDNSGDSEVGYFSKRWDMDLFNKFEGEITLKND